MNRISKMNLAAMIVVSGMASAAMAQSEQVVFFENFDGLALGPNTEEGILTGSGGAQTNVWTADFPAGWTRDFSLPGVGVLEWQGWHVADGRWWSLACGDQNRSNFVTPAENGLSRGGAAIADADEWDDFDANGLDPSGQGTFDAFMTTPAFSLVGVTANTMEMSFFSSWRDEAPQVATLEVSFDGGSWQEVFRWTGDSLDPNFKNDAENEIFTVAVNNPSGAASAQFRFGLSEAGNNWWWAVDSIQVSALKTGTATVAPGYSFISGSTFNATGRPTVTIGEAAGATSYQVVVAKDAAFSDVRLTANSNASGAFQLPGIANGIYYVKAVATNAAGSRDSENAIRIVVDNPIFADLDGSGQLNFFDVSAYLGLYNAGCP